MNKIQLVVLCLLGLWTVSSLRLDSQHLSYDNTEDYLQGLLDQQK